MVPVDYRGNVTWTTESSVEPPTQKLENESVVLQPGAGPPNAGAVAIEEHPMVFQTPPPAPVLGPPRELVKTALPPYMIEPPDILLVEAVPRGASLKYDQPISGSHLVRPDGTISLGRYGAVKVGGLTVSQAREAIAELLKTKIAYKATGEVFVLLNKEVDQFEVPEGTTIKVGGQEFITPQTYQVRGPNAKGFAGEEPARPLKKKETSDGIFWEFSLPVQAKEAGPKGNVRPTKDGTIPGWIPPAGEIKRVEIREEFTGGGEFDIRDLNVDVLAYNSKFYYIITDGGGLGFQLFKFPIMGSETVLDALSNIYGVPAVADPHKIWLARRAPGNCGVVMPLDWAGIIKGGTNTNYQLFPGDRIFVQSDHWIRGENWLAKRLAPFERLLGVTLLGSQTVNSIKSGGTSGSGL